MFQESAEAEKKVIVAVKQGTLLATAFHPELTADTRWWVLCFLSESLFNPKTKSEYLFSPLVFYIHFTTNLVVQAQLFLEDGG